MAVMANEDNRDLPAGVVEWPGTLSWGSHSVLARIRDVPADASAAQNEARAAHLKGLVATLTEKAPRA